MFRPSLLHAAKIRPRRPEIIVHGMKSEVADTTGRPSSPPPLPPEDAQTKPPPSLVPSDVARKHPWRCTCGSSIKRMGSAKNGFGGKGTEKKRTTCAGRGRGRGGAGEDGIGRLWRSASASGRFALGFSRSGGGSVGAGGGVGVSVAMYVAVAVGLCASVGVGDTINRRHLGSSHGDNGLGGCIASLSPLRSRLLVRCEIEGDEQQQVRAEDGASGNGGKLFTGALSYVGHVRKVSRCEIGVGGEVHEA